MQKKVWLAGAAKGWDGDGGASAAKIGFGGVDSAAIGVQCASIVRGTPGTEDGGEGRGKGKSSKGEVAARMAISRSWSLKKAVRAGGRTKESASCGSYMETYINPFYSFSNSKASAIRVQTPICKCSPRSIFSASFAPAHARCVWLLI